MDRLTRILAVSGNTQHLSYWAAYRSALIRIGGIPLASEARYMLAQHGFYKFGTTTLRVVADNYKLSQGKIDIIE